MRQVKNIASIVLITIVLFLLCDFTLSHLGFTPHRKHNSTTAACYVHPVYHYDLKPNLDIFSPWGPITSRLCTNSFGFRVACSSAGETRKDFDLAFIGDSFTESIGTTYEDSFVGLYAQTHPQLAVVNLGVRGYSATHYWKKIEFLLRNGFTFKHIVVLPDLSDISDEASLAVDEKSDASVVQAGASEDTHEKAAKVAIQDENFFHKILKTHFKFTWYMNSRIYDYFYIDDDAVFKKLVEYPPGEWTRNIESPNFGKEGVRGAIQKNLTKMRKLKQLLDTHNIRMTIVVYPWPTQLFFENASHLGMQIWKDFCAKEACYNFIDANPYFFDEIERSSRRAVIEKYYIRGDIHFNTEGNKKLFEAINAQLTP